MLTNNSPQRGFTLVELVLTLIIAGAIAAIAIPRFFTTTSFEQRGYSDELVNALRYAQGYAVRTRCNTRVQISAGGYQLFRPASRSNCQSTNSADLATAITHPVNSNEAFQRNAPNGITLTNTSVIYTSLGGTTSTQQISIGSQQIRIEAATGYVHRL